MEESVSDESGICDESNVDEDAGGEFGVHKPSLRRLPSGIPKPPRLDQFHCPHQRARNAYLVATHSSPRLAHACAGLVWGMKGFTALSPCWEGEVNSGQIPITLLTRRHGYTRGHGMGVEGFNKRQLGAKVWFLATDNSLVTMTIRCGVVRAGRQGDYTLFLFDRDLPDTIQPLRVAAPAEVQSRYLASARGGGGNYPVFKTEQGGNVSAEVAGFTVDTWKGGDSGSPNLLPLPGELVFFGGRSTSGPSVDMQADMDALSKMEGLSPNDYQLRWVDLSKFPSY
jgi:hypothetical protein